MKTKTSKKPINVATLNQRAYAKAQGKSRRSYCYEQAIAIANAKAPKKGSKA